MRGRAGKRLSLLTASRLAPCFALSLSLSLGCAVDDRVLTAALGGGGANAGSGSDTNAGTAGDAPSNGGAGSSDGGAVAGAPNEAGAAGEAGAATVATVPICSDTAPAPNCKQSLVLNATFDTDTAHWTPDPGSTQDWLQQDADQRASSGSLAVHNTMVTSDDGSVIAGSGQCVSIAAGDVYDVSASVFIAGNQGSSGVGGFYASLYPTTDCSGAALSYFGQSTLPDATDVWSNAHMVVDTTPQNLNTAQTMSLRMVAQKAFSAAPLTVIFDNVLVQKAASQ
ncbi:MAG TPA: hypothetical protein VHW01_05055 [Polyangiaceae bacterium]|jgi:hypothetical protein|nr:hypothetical protein [Polyangiaceae bacterium]